MNTYLIVKNPAHYFGHADGGYGLRHGVLSVLGEPFRLGGGAGGGVEMGDEGGLVVHHAGGDFPAALGFVDAALFRHAAHVGQGMAVGEVDVGAVCAGGGVLAAGGVAANQDGAPGGCGLAGGRKYAVGQLQRYQFWWEMLGYPAFCATVVMYFLMVLKPM